MDAGATDVFQLVEYRRDKWMMNRVPVALLLVVAGLVLVLYFDRRPSPGPDILLAFVVLVALTGGLVVCYMLYDYMHVGRNFALRVLAGVGAFFLGVILLSTGIVRVAGVWRAPHVPPYIAGWAFVIAGAGFVAAALFRHLRPPRAIMTLSPAGLAYHGPLIKNLLIPWSEVEGVGAMVRIGVNGVPFRHEDYPAVTVSKAFFEQHIAPQRSVMRGPRASWDGMFVEKGASMQMGLHPIFFSTKPKDLREPVEARWKAFRNGPPAGEQAAPAAPPLVHGVWSLTLWQAIAFGVPLIAIAAILLHSTGLWPRG